MKYLKVLKWTVLFSYDQTSKGGFWETKFVYVAMLRQREVGVTLSGNDLTI